VFIKNFKGKRVNSERGRSSSEGGVGSITETADIPLPRESGTVTKKSSIRQQFSLNDELLSRERLEANKEVRKGIRKQQSLPDEGGKRKYRTLRESFLMAVKKGTALENLKNSFSLFRVPEEETTCSEQKIEEADEVNLDEITPSTPKSDLIKQVYSLLFHIRAYYLRVL